MTRRAIILVPGFARRERLEARDHLVEAIGHYTDGYSTTASEGTENNGFNSVRIDVTSRADDSEIKLDVFEAHWGDLIPDWSNESPWQRFKRGSILVGYWTCGGLLKSMFRGEAPSRTIIGMSVAGLALLFWYLVIIALLIQAIRAGDAQIPRDLVAVLEFLHLADPLRALGDLVVSHPFVILLLGLVGMGSLERVSNIAAFTKAYLSDDILGEGHVGLRAKSRKRVLEALDHVHDPEREADETYDEVYVVAHSLGGAIAVDALAEYGARLGKTTLFTWGTALGSLVQQEPLIEAEIQKFYTSPTQIRNWLDVVFRMDMMGSAVPRPRLDIRGWSKETHSQIFPDTFVPPMPRGRWLRLAKLHDDYYACEDAVLMLVRPATELPQHPEGAQS